MKRILAGLLAMVLGVGLSLSAAQPALANGQASKGCNDVGITNIRVCLYNSTNFSKANGFWQRDLATVGQNCVILSNHYWHTGNRVNNETSSVIITAGSVPTNTQFKVRFYDHVNCSSANGYFDMFATFDGSSDIRNYLTLRWDDAIGSVQIFLEAA